MKLGVIVGETDKGEWEALALPDKAVQSQRVLFKSLKVNGGLIKIGKQSKRYKRVYLFDNFSKRVFFHPEQSVQPEIQ